MMEIICNNELYTYNVYHIAKAFFPAEEVRQQVDRESGMVVCVTLPDGQKIMLPEQEMRSRLRAFGDGEVRKLCKYTVDCWLYDRFKEYTGQVLSWGILTGVRPTKIAMQKVEEGMGAEEFVSWFRKDSLVSERKARLAYEIALREKDILSPLDYRDGYSLYVGIPFCPSVCSYCSFSSGSIVEWKDWVESYLDALCKEIRFVGEKSETKKLNTIYIGGGTPTTLTAEQLERLLTCIDETFSRRDLLEYTVEAGRPDSITEEKLRVLRAHGITRISINPQTMQQKTLDLIGRKHTVGDICRVYEMARILGFDNINMDLIAGLPGERIADMEDTLRQIREMSPDSLTVHSLAIKRAAKMGREKSETGYIKDLAELTEHPEEMAKELSAMIEAAHETAEKMRLLPYYLYRQKNIAGNFENVGYAKVDKAGIYNILIMEEKQSIIAAGAGASTKIVLKNPIPMPGSKKKKMTRLIRQENVKAVDAYIDRIDEMIERKGEWLWH